MIFVLSVVDREPSELTIKSSPKAHVEELISCNEFVVYIYSKTVLLTWGIAI